VNNVLVHRPAETGSYLSTNSECVRVILVPAAYVITVIGTVFVSSSLGKIHAFWQIEHDFKYSED